MVSSLEQKIWELEEEISGMRKWAKLLLSANTTLETNMDKKHVTSQATFQNNPPPTHPNSHPQINKAPFICFKGIVNFKITHILPNIMFMLLDLHISLCACIIPPCKLLDMRRHRTRFLGIAHVSYHFKFLHIKCLHVRTILYHIKNWHILSTMTKPLMSLKFSKTFSMLRRSPSKIYTSLAKSIDQLYENLKVVGCMPPIPAKNPNTQSKWYDPNKIWEYN
ncbi:hypothetical protein KY285_024957 [Solanum tuberosum]|nr:hypothetical protein KY285_024957 [Solanum tuberosum]